MWPRYASDVARADGAKLVRLDEPPSLFVVMRSAFLLVLIGCQQGGTKQPPSPTPVPARAIDANAIDAAPPIGDTYVETVDESLRRLAAGESALHTCFAVSANHRRVACVSISYDSEADGPRNIVILGDVGDARSEWTLDELPTVRQALADRKYIAFDPQGTELVKTATVGKYKLRRNRKITIPAVVARPNEMPGDPDFIDGSWNTYEDRIELACGSHWVDAHLDDLLNLRYGDEIAMRVSAFDDRHILLEVEGSWGIEGAHGSTAGAQLIDTAALCH
jgi:hypothetical protein